MAWIVYILAPRLGYETVLWHTPLEVIYALEHTHLWVEGMNTQGTVNLDDFYKRLEKAKENYHGKS